MKYSIIMPYYDRPELKFSLDSYRDLYKGRSDFEVIIVEDSKNTSDIEMHNALLDIIDRYPELCIRIVQDPKISYNPTSKYNFGVKRAFGKIMLLTNPEVPHVSDILKFIDNSEMDNLYIVCACLAVHLVKPGKNFKDSEFKSYMWYQHTQYRDVRYHFCTVITRDNYINKVKGFDERYCGGIAYDDDNFVKRVMKSGLIILPVDDLVTYHIEHSRNYKISSEEFNRLVEINRSLWTTQLATDNFF